MKITKVHIDEFKIFKDFDIDFTHEGKAQNLIVLAGINGSGKTTLMEYLYKSAETSTIGKGNIAIERANGSTSRVVTNNEPKGFAIIPEHFDQITYIKADEKVEEYIEQAISNFIDTCIYEKNMLAFDAYSYLKEFIDDVLRGFDIGIYFKSLTAQKQPIFSNNVYFGLTVSDLSSGEKQLLSTVVWLFTEQLKDKIILIDEPEFSLHPSWQNMIAQVYQRYADEYNCQIILATHSPQIIGSVKPEQLRILQNVDGVIKVANPVEHSYGLPVDKVLMEVMGIKHLRTPDIDTELDSLNAMISNNEYDSSEFVSKMKKMEETLGYADRDLVLMRFEIAKRKKQR